MPTSFSRRAVGTLPLVAAVLCRAGVAAADDEPSPPAVDVTAPAPPAEPAPPPPPPPAPAFTSDPVGYVAQETSLSLKMYGDTQFQVKNHADVKASFSAPHLDLFATADVGKVGFLAETFFEARDNEVAVDVERLQVSYLFSNSLRARAGRTHTAFGYYNDTYHHGNLFELTANRPRSVEFEDDGGLLVAHLVGAGIDGTVEAGAAGSFRYDLEVGNGRLANTTGVAIEEAGKTAKMVNLRLRWMPIDGLIAGVNGVYDAIPQLDGTPDVATRPEIRELVAGAHLVYMEHHVHVLAEVMAIRHEPTGERATTTMAGFAELGYQLGDFTPYVRPEWIRFPKGGDLVYQGAGSQYAATRDVTDLRIGVKWQPVPQVALKLEGQRATHDGSNQELATVKIAFGF